MVVMVGDVLYQQRALLVVGCGFNFLRSSLLILTFYAPV